MLARARMANRAAPTLLSEAVQERIQNTVTDGLMAAGMSQEAAEAAAPWLAMLPEIVPGVGMAVSADNTTRAAIEGDYGDAALEAGLGLLGEIPLFGDLGKAAILGIMGKRVPTRTKGEKIETEVYDKKNEKGYSENPVIAEIDPDGPRPDNIAKGDWKRRQAQARDPNLQPRDQARPAGGVAEAVDDLEATLISYEDLAREGRPLIWLPADGSTVADVVQTGGRTHAPVRSRGGPLHADAYGSWMSGWSAAKGKQLHANKVYEQTGQMPIYMHLNMDDAGLNFSHMPSEIWANIVDKYGLSDEAWGMIDQRMRAIPDVKGDGRGIAEDWALYNPQTPKEVLDYLTPHYGGEHVGRSTYGNRRKAFIPTVARPGVVDAGGPIMNDIYSALMEPELLGQQGMAGFRGMGSVFADPSELARDFNRHYSYDTIIPGDGVYMFEEGLIPWQIMFPDAAARRADKTAANAYSSLRNNGTEYQMPDKEWLQGIIDYLEETK